MAIGKIEFSRVPVSIWGVLIALSYAPLLAHMFFPFINYTEYYYTVSLMENTVLSFFRSIAEQIPILGNILYGGALAVTGIMMFLESLVKGFLPLWKVMGLDRTINGVNLAHILQATVYLLYPWALYRTVTGGVRG